MARSMHGGRCRLVARWNDGSDDPMHICLFDFLGCAVQNKLDAQFFCESSVITVNVNDAHRAGANRL